MSSINPAYATIDKETTIISSLRDQRTAEPDAPVSQSVSFGKPLAVMLVLVFRLSKTKPLCRNRPLLGLTFRIS
jgi:hypothetical protein